MSETPASYNYKRDNKANVTGIPKMDQCQTPAYALDPLLPYLDSRWVIWEPAAGEGYLAGALARAGFTVTAGDILTGQDFFKSEPAYDCQVTNPPYSIKYTWLKRCYDLGRPFALLLPVETVGAQTAQRLFERHGVELVLLDKRVNFKMPNAGWNGGGAQFSTLWVTWGLSIGRELTFGKLTPRPQGQSVMRFAS